MVVAAAVHTGCPQPLALTPGICPACAVMSYTMLSVRVPSGLTPAEHDRVPKLLRTRHAML